jgi:hypothetical protein
MPVLRKRIHFWAAGWLGSLLVRALYRTCRIQVIDPAGIREGVRARRRPVVAAFWHRHILTMLAHHGGFPICVPVSEHQDGEYVAQVMERFGLESIRGSTTRGSLNVVRGALAWVRQGWSPAITPDGPRGPSFSVQPGVALLAKRTGLPVCPIGLAVKRAWELSSWDRFVIPKPWTDIAIVFGGLLEPAGFPTVPAFCKALRESISAATDQAACALE